MSREQTTQPVLGVTVTPRAVYALLIEVGEGRPRVLRRFTRQRSAAPGEPVGAPGAMAGVGMPGGAGSLPGLDGGDDFTLQVGDGASGGTNDYFLNAEFNLDDVKGEGDAAARPQPFTLELSDILSECRDAGYARPRVALCGAARYVEAVEMLVPDIAPEAGADVSRRKLTARLKEQQQTEVDPERTAFLPLTPGEAEGSRYLALTAASADPVVPTLEALRKDHRRLAPRLQFLDTEVPLYAGMARATFADEIGRAADEATTTLVVRAGEEDTLVLFLEGDRLCHTETLRSLTAHDAPETVCSRVLLLQDEYGIGEVDHVLLLAGDDGADMVESFEMFFPAARIESMHRGAAEQVGEQEPLGAGMVQAALVALRVAAPRGYAAAFDGVNLLPRRLLRRQVEMPIGWPSVGMLVLLFFTALFFVWRFVALESDIGEARQELRAYTAQPLEHDPRVLQGRIDSLQHTATTIARSLEVMDGLLVGSDRWSRAMERIARRAASVQGIWVDRWTPSGDHLVLAGNATSRARVVQLAEMIGADIETLSFSEIREWTVYSFTMKFTLTEELPAATRYLRARAEQEAARERPTDAAPAPASPVSYRR